MLCFKQSKQLLCISIQWLINGQSKSNDTYELLYRARVHIEKKEVRNYDGNPFETDKKMKKGKQATTKTSFLNLSGSKISIVVTATVPKDEGDYEVND